MRHRIAGKHLGRNHNERQALFKNQLKSLFTHGTIQTTDARVKALQPLVYKTAKVLVKKDIVNAQRYLNRLLNDRTLTSRIYKSFKAVFAELPATLLNVVPVKFRQGDNALIVKLSLTNNYSLLPVEAEPKVEKKTVKKVKKVVKK